jgi:hypothetical protein
MVTVTYHCSVMMLIFICIQGGLGACVSKQDVLAETKDDLMYLQGIIIITVMNDMI